MVALHDAPDGGRHCGELGIGEINPRHGFLDRRPTLSEPRWSWRTEFPRHEGPAPWEISAGQARLSNYCAAA